MMTSSTTEATTSASDQEAMETSEESVLRLTNVRKNFGSVSAIKDVSFSIPKGQIVTLLGPSGCGKSTTLRLVMGLERSTSGTIEYDGRLVDSEEGWIPAHKRSMGMVFQTYAIWPHMTVAKNVAYPLELRRTKRSEIKRRIADVIEMVGLTGFEDRPATRLSGGQMQRVALARALVYNPHLLLLDEPFSNLDALLREQMRFEVKSIQRRLGLTVLFVTHDQSEALSMSDSVILMREGNIVQAGTPEELYDAPADAFVRDFMGTTVTVRGTLESVHGTHARVVFPSGEHLVGQLRDEAARVGDTVEFSVRPEAFSVDPDQDLDTTDRGAIRVDVVAKLFVGDRYELQVRTAWGQEIQAYCRPSERIREGDTVQLVPEADAGRVWLV